MKIHHASILAIAATLFALSSSSAQHSAGEHSPGVKFREFYALPYPPLPGKVVRLIELELAPRSVVDTHTHPGYEYGNVTQGTLMLKVGDEPCRSIGEPFSVPPNTPMTVKNTTDKIAKMNSLLIGVEKDHYIDCVGPHKDLKC